MAEENSPNPSEAPKPQAKKETVRISLPSKPTAASTVKLSAPKPSAASKPAAVSGGAAAKPAAASAPAASGTPVPRPAARAARTPTVSPVDKGLAIFAAITAILAVARLYMLGS